MLLVFAQLFSCENQSLEKENDYELDQLSLIPLPQEVDLRKGHFTFLKSTNIYVSTEALNGVGQYLKDHLKLVTGMDLEISKEKINSQTIVLQLNPSINSPSGI